MLTPLRLCRKSAASFNHANGSITRCFASLPGGNFEDDQPAFEFVRQNLLTTKPRTTGLTEMRGPYYTPMGPRYLRDILEGISHAVDSIKFAGGSFAILRRKTVKELIDIAHEHGVSVSTGGWVEHVIPQGRETVQRYFTECKNLGFDTVELSTGFISLPTQDLVRMVHDAQNAGLHPKPEVGCQFGAGGDTPARELAAERQIPVEYAIRRAEACLDAGSRIVMMESEGITENVMDWRTDIIENFIGALGLERLMFEAADPHVFEYYVRTYGAEVNLFVDHSQVVQLECLRRGIWGTKKSFGRILQYR